MADIQIRRLRDMDEMRRATEVQKIYWGDDPESVVPAHMLYSLVEHGGHVLAALEGERIVGVLIGFLGTNIEESHRPAMANLLIASKRMVVLPEYRSRGIGYRLKLAQRELALQQGVRLVTWTFDPLLAANAYLNIRKLGAICQTYRQDYYGADSLYATAGSSDRLIAEWWVTARRVKERINGSRGDLTLTQYLEGNATLVNATRVKGDGLPTPAEQTVGATSALVLLEIPVDFMTIVKQDEALARAWRAHSREPLRGMLDAGYIATDFVREEYEGRNRAFYLLSYNLSFDFSMN